MLAPVRDIRAELADVRQTCPEVLLVTPAMASSIVDQLIASGARHSPPSWCPKRRATK